MSALKSAARVRDAEPTWEVAELFPTRGNWSEEEYLALPDNRLMELSGGFLEVLPMPTTSHQALVAYMYGLLLSFVSQRNLGKVFFAPIRLRLWPGKFREPDVVFMLKAHSRRIGEEFWERADLAIEVLSRAEKGDCPSSSKGQSPFSASDPKDRRRDLVTKRREYARARIPEYWIVDPQEAVITVLRLAGKRYAVHGSYGSGSHATSHLLPGFSVDVSATFAQALAALPPGRKASRTRR